MSCNVHPSTGNSGGRCDPNEPMQAISAILNPDTVGREADVTKRVFLFQSLPNRTVGFDQVDFVDNDVNAQKDGTDGVQGYYANPPGFAPTLRSRSKLVSTVFDRFVHVYGVNQQTGAVSLVSPVFMPLKNSFATFNNIAACSSGEKAWLYFQMRDESGSLYIWEKDLSDLDSSPTIVDGTDDAAAGTDLIAFYDGNTRWIVYQKIKKGTRISSKIVLKGVDQDETSDIKDSDVYLDDKLARIAAVHARSEKDGIDRVFIYFADKNNKVWRAQANITEENPKFDKPESLATQTIINDYTSMSVVADPTKRENVIYTMLSGSKSINVRRDKWSSK